MADKSIPACKRCKQKKLKCDNNPRDCSNCFSVAAPCLQIDIGTGREYARSYIPDLKQKISNLKDVLQNSSGTRATETSSVQRASPSTPTPSYHGQDTVASMARMVEAAVGSQSVDNSLVDIHSQLAQERENLGRMKATPASFPPMHVAQELINSYLNGPHILHPFLRRAEIFSELDDVYTNLAKAPPLSLFRTHMVFAIGAVALVRAGLHHVPALNYYTAAMQLAQETLGLSALEHIQALLLIVLFSIQHDIGVGCKWDLARVAMRICIENGLHKRRDVGFGGTMAEQMRRRVFWACYVSDRHSSSTLGRPNAIRDEDITVEMPLDADDDLIESGRLDAQLIRGPSEVSAQLRQISLRQGTSQIGTRLHRAGSNAPTPEKSINDILSQLSYWRKTFPRVLEPQSVYDTQAWRDLNYHRERLKCFRYMVLTRRDYTDEAGLSARVACLEAAAEIPILYGFLRASDKLVLNWTCVHDIMSAGFTSLYCGLAGMDNSQRLSNPLQPKTAGSSQDLADIRRTTDSVIDTLLHISDKWTPVRKHLQVFQALASQVLQYLQSPGLSDGITSREVAQTGAPELRPAWLNDLELAGPWDGEVGVEANMWDAAMTAFVEDPTHLGDIDWGVVDWDAAGLYPSV